MMDFPHFSYVYPRVVLSTSVFFWEVSKNEGTPESWWKIHENPMKMDDEWMIWDSPTEKETTNFRNATQILWRWPSVIQCVCVFVC